MNPKQFLIRWLKRDGVAILFFGLTTIIMSYPLIFRLGGDWVSTGEDVFVKLWDIWRLDQVLSMGQEPFFTDRIFYPDGLSLAFHNLSWTTSILNWLLVPISGSILSAYKATILIGLFATAYGAYLLIRELTQDRSAAWCGGAIYAYAPFIIAHSKSHPDVAFTVTIPIAALLFIRAIRNDSLPAAIAAGLTIGLAAFTSMYILTFTSLTIGFIYISLALEKRRWSTLQFWRVTVVFGAVVLALIGIRLLPWLTNLNNISGIIDSVYQPAVLQADLMAFFTPSVSHQVFEPFIADIAENFEKSRGQPPYLGIVPIALTLSALTWKKRRRDVWPWFGIGIFFFFLSLGSVLRINGEHYEQIPMLLPYLDWFPPLRGVRTNFYVVGLLLPLAVCSAFGLLRWLQVLENKRNLQIILVGCLSLLLLFEFWNGPYPLVENRVNRFYAELANNPDDFAIVELPMNRNDAKRRLYYQTVHGHPMVEGATSRTPNSAYRYINHNLLLSAWRAADDLECDKISSLELEKALDQLVSDNIRYVIVHSATLQEPFSSYFTMEPIYQDDAITVLDLLQLRENPPCAAK